MPLCRCCPGPEDLQALLDGTLTDEDQARLTTHLDTCDGCQQRLESLSGIEGESLEGVGQGERATPALEGVMRRLCGDTDAFVGEDDEEAEAPLPRLAPSDRPGVLGCFGPYEVVEVLGRGGMGVVFKALDPTLDRFVALKVLAPQLAASSSARQRFAREARATAAVEHGNVVPVHQVASADGLPYLVMPCVPGESLQRRLDREGPLPIALVARFGMQVAAGLAAAHACGLVHRDVKPGNILVQEAETVEGDGGGASDPVARLTDFGLARLRDDASVTHSGFLAGTPQYMSPEQARGEPVDGRTDLFSLGSVLYAMCTGRPPFEASTTLAVLRRVSEESPPRIQKINPRVPDWLVEIMTHLHAKDPARRPSAANVSRQLGWHLERLAQGEVPLPRRTPRKSRWAALAAGLLLLLTGLAVTEETGRTRLGAWLAEVIRVKTPEGTLVIHVNDSSVKVTVDGEEVVLGGKGLAEIRIRAGKHRVQATRGKETVHDEIVSITRDGKEVVRVTVEPPPTVRDAGVRNPSRTLRGHRGAVRALTVSPDGRLVATGGADRVVRVFERASGKALLVLHGHEGVVVSVGFLPGGKVLVSVDNRGKVQTWELPTGKQRSRLTIPDGFQLGVFAPGAGRLATTTPTGTVRVWQVEEKVVGVASLPAGKAVSQVAFSPDGHQLATAGADGKVRVWVFSPKGARPASVRELAPSESGNIRSLAFSPDGKWLASSDDKGPVILWDVETGKRLHQPPALAGSGVAFGPRGKRLALVKGAEVQILDVATRKVQFTLRGPRGTVTRVLFGPAGDSVLAARTDGTVSIWELRAGRAEGALPGLEGGPKKAWWKRADLAIPGKGQKGTKILAFHPDGQRLATVSGKEILLLDMRTGKLLWKLAGHTRPVISLAFLPDGKRLVSVDAGGSVTWWDPGTGKRLHTLDIGTSVGTGAFRADARVYLATAGKGKARLWDITEGKPLSPEIADLGWIHRTHVGRDGRQLLVVSMGKLQVWDQTGKALRTLVLNPSGQPVDGVAFSPDDRILAAATGDLTVRLWDVSSGKQLRSVKGVGAKALAFRPDVKMLALASGRVVKLLDLATGAVTETLDPGTPHLLIRLAFSPDGRCLAATDADGTIFLWKVEEKR